MATTTPNYGWSVPTSTDLVKDGATAIETLGDSVDATVKALNPETTLGDIAYRSSTANTNTRLGIGSTGQVLTVASGVPSWVTPSAGGNPVAQIASGSMPAATQLQLTGLSSYSKLILQIKGVTNATADTQYYFRVNNNSGATTYRYSQIGGYAPETYAAPSMFPGSSEDGRNVINLQAGYPQRYNSGGGYWIELDNCKETGMTLVDAQFWGDIWNGSASRAGFARSNGITTNAAAVSSIEFFNLGGYNFNGGTYVLWGS